MDKKVIVTGSRGLLGSALKEELGEGHVYTNSFHSNLLDKEKSKHLFWVQKDYCDTIIHCAAKVGGVQANMDDNEGFWR